MQLIINKKQINGNLIDILNKAKTESHKDILKTMKNSGDYLMVCCPFHKNGKEAHPSCGIMQSRKDPSITFGDYHCFSCGSRGNLQTAIAHILGTNVEFAEKWLVDHFGGTQHIVEDLPQISLEKPKPKYMSEDILTLYDYYHPYMWKRKLTKEVVDKFRVGYDRARYMITFPVWDISNHLVMVTARSVINKNFYIQKNIDKPVYLLNYIIKEQHPVAMITEAQIDALTAWSYGFPCCATIGSLSYSQIKILNRSGIRTFITAFDNDEHGREFTEFFNKYIKKDVILYNFKFPPNKKDINDLTKEEFWASLNELGFKEK